RLRFPLAALSLAATLFASAAVAQTQPAAAVVAQEPAQPQSQSQSQLQPQPQPQPQPSVQQGQTFEEEIIPQRYANNAKIDAF
ncbi:lytic murein transglycosylase B, partial [Burkholderia pseudomallei]|nr:lytic murein transglycosylase B [Burkholderia pseudomallei]